LEAAASFFKILLSLLLTVLLSYLIFQMHQNFIAGMNPYVNGVFSLAPVIPFVVNSIVISKIKVKGRRRLLWFAMFLGVLIAVICIVFYKPAFNNAPTRRYYIDSSGI